MRKLSDVFLNDLKEGGRLFPLTEAVKSDPSLCLELRGNYVNVYYRGGNLMRVAQAGTDYTVFFDRNYFEAGRQTTLPDEREGVDAWLDISPELKQAIDRWLGKRRKDEREFQQVLLRDNNFGRVARSTDYYICDIEYQSEYGRFDLIAVEWPSKSAVRKQANGRRLVFIEMKHGDGALEGNAGLHKHIQDVNRYLSDQTKLSNLKQEMVEVFNQKREIWLIDCGKDLNSFSDESPMLLLVLANHDPGKQKLHELLRSLPESPHAELCIATASFMGYGLYEQGIHKMDEALGRFADYVYSS